MDDKTYTFTQDDVRNLLYLLDTLLDRVSGLDFGDLVLISCYLHILDAMLTEGGAVEARG